MRSTIVSLSAAALLVMVVTGAAAAGPGWGGRGRLLGPEGRLLRGGSRMAEELKLTGVQRQKLRDIGGDLVRQVIKTRADLAVARLDLARDLRSEAPELKEIEGQIDAVATLEASLMKSAASARLEARKVLTVEQRRQLEEIRFRGERQSVRERRDPGGSRRQRDGRDSSHEGRTPGSAAGGEE